MSSDSRIQLSVSPDIVPVSTGEANSVIPDLALTIQNTGASALSLIRIEFELPVGTSASDLIVDASSIGTQGASGWTFVPSEGEPGVFIAISDQLEFNLEPDHELEFALQSVTINQAVGVAEIKVRAGEASASVAITKQAESFGIQSFSANPVVVSEGGSAELSWETTAAAAVSIRGPLKDHTRLAARGSLHVTPQETSTYTLVVEGDGANLERQITVSVIQPTIVHFAANPTIAEYPGDTVTLTWETADANLVVDGVQAFTGYLVAGEGPLFEVPADDLLKGSHEITVSTLGGCTMYLKRTSDGTVFDERSISMTFKEVVINSFTLSETSGVTLGKMIQATWDVSNSSKVSLLTTINGVTDTPYPELSANTGGIPVHQPATYTIQAAGFKDGDVNAVVKSSVSVSVMPPTIHQFTMEPEKPANGDKIEFSIWAQSYKARHLTCAVYLGEEGTSIPMTELGRTGEHGEIAILTAKTKFDSQAQYTLSLKGYNEDGKPFTAVKSIGSVGLRFPDSGLGPEEPPGGWT